MIIKLIPLALGLTVLLGLIHAWDEMRAIRQKKPGARTQSFVAGISVAYIFLFLMPELHEAVNTVHQWLFVLVLVGFAFMHLSEKYLYQHAKELKRLVMHNVIHFFILFIYYFSVGLILPFILIKGVLEGLLFYIPLLFYATFGIVSFSEVHLKLKTRKLIQWLIAVAPVIGTLTAPFFKSVPLLYQGLLAFVIGAFLYIVLIEFLPKEKEGRPLFFIYGMGLYALLIVVTWNINL